MPGLLGALFADAIRLPPITITANLPPEQETETQWAAKGPADQGEWQGPLPGTGGPAKSGWAVPLIVAGLVLAGAWYYKRRKGRGGKLVTVAPAA